MNMNMNKNNNHASNRIASLINQQLVVVKAKPSQAVQYLDGLVHGPNQTPGKVQLYMC